MKIVLIDGDEVAYKAAFVSEVPIKWDEDTWTLHSSETDMIDSIETLIGQALKDTYCEMTYVALSGRNNFRLDVYPEYKASRIAHAGPSTRESGRTLPNLPLPAAMRPPVTCGGRGDPGRGFP